MRITTLAAVLATAALSTTAFGQNQNFIMNARVAAIGPAAAPGVVHKPFAEPMTADKIRAAVDDAIQYLRSQQAADGSMEAGGRQGGGTALSALALLAAGADPEADTQLAKALDYLAKLNPDDTYVRGIRANVWEYALRKNPANESYKKNLKADFDWLIAALGNKEGWRYTKESGDWDNSCTQYGVLGIWAAARAGIDPGEKFWQTMSTHFRTRQAKGGGWDYTGSGGSSAAMTTAGLASMFLVLDQHVGKSFYSAEKPRAFTSGDAAAVLASLETGMTWLGSDHGAKDDSYYLYGIERTGVAYGRKYFGGEDWFKRGALAALHAQQPDGSIPLGSWGGGAISTSLCTLFLVYGGAPVAYNKLEYGKDAGGGQDWNLNPRDLANVSKFLWGAYESPLNWQTVSIASPASEYDAPILFISGSKAAQFSDAETARLRDYILGGGTILAEPSDHSADFAASIRQLAAKMFPPADYPSYKFTALPPDHGVYTVIKQDFKSRPKLQGISNGSRTFFFLSEDYMSADFQMDKEDSDSFKLAMNLLFYATDLDTLQGKFASALPDTPAAAPRPNALTLARIKFTGSASAPRDWDAADQCWSKFAPCVKHVTGCDLKEAPPVTLGETDLKDIKLLHLTGRSEFTLTDAETKALKSYVDSGGTVLVDAYAGSPAFAASARKQLETVFGPLVPLPADSMLAAGRFQGGQDLHSISLKLPARQALRAKGLPPQGQQLLIALQGKRPAVIFSDIDIASAMAGIENYKSLGYKPSAARKIAGNLAAYLTAE